MEKSTLSQRIEVPYLSVAQQSTLQCLLAAADDALPNQLIEQAGQSLARLAQQLLDEEIVDRPIVVLAGRGGNGAGGLVAARHLIQAGAWVQIVLSHLPEEYHHEPAAQLSALAAIGAPLAWAEEGWELPPADLVIDALIGWGLRGAPHGKVRELIQLANSSVAPILSLAAPSGLDVQTGALSTPYLQATATLALALPPVALVRQPGRTVCGDLYLADRGIPRRLYSQLGLSVPPLLARDTIIPLDVENDRVFARVSSPEDETEQ